MLTANVGGVAQNLTITGANNYVISNLGGGDATLLSLGGGATSSYTSTGAVIDTVTLGAAGQSVTTAFGNDIVNSSAANLAGSTVSMGGGAGDTLNLSSVMRNSDDWHKVYPI